MRIGKTKILRSIAAFTKPTATIWLRLGMQVPKWFHGSLTCLHVVVCRTIIIIRYAATTATLMYHRIRNHLVRNVKIRRYSIRTENFAAHVTNAYVNMLAN